MIYNFFNSYIYEFYFFPFFLDYFLGNEPFINLIMFSEFLFVTHVHFLFISSFILFVGMVGGISISFFRVQSESASISIKQSLLNQSKRQSFYFN